MLGRFISPDTVVPDFANPQSFNRYSYALGNPVKYRDPSGHDVDCGLGESSCRQQVAVEKQHTELAKALGASIEVRSAGYPGKPLPSEYRGITNAVATTASVIGIGLDLIQTVGSAIGTVAEVGGTALDPPVGLGVGLFSDEMETRFGDLGVAFSGLGDLAGGYTYLDRNNQEVVLGQATTLALGQQVADNLLPANSPSDLAMNVPALGLDVSNFFGGTQSYIEYRRSLSQNKLVIYTQPLRDTKNNLKDFFQSGAAVKCPSTGCWSK